MSKHGHTNVFDLHKWPGGHPTPAPPQHPDGKTLGVCCSTCGCSWIAGEAPSLEPGSFVRETRGMRAECPRCGAHQRMIGVVV